MAEFAAVPAPSTPLPRAAVVTGRDGRTPTLVSIERNGLSYEFHTVTGTESLWDTALPVVERRNLIGERPDAARQLRAQLMLELGITDLESLRSEQQTAIDRLRRLGYL